MTRFLRGLRGGETPEQCYRYIPEIGLTYEKAGLSSEAGQGQPQNRDHFAAAGRRCFKVILLIAVVDVFVNRKFGVHLPSFQHTAWPHINEKGRCSSTCLRFKV